MRNLLKQVANDRSHGLVNRGGRGHVRFKSSSRELPHRTRQVQCLLHSPYPRREERGERRRPKSVEVEETMMYIRDLVTSDFPVRSLAERAAQAADGPCHLKATPVMLAPSCM